MSSKQVTATDALRRLESLCARSEQCTYDLRRKLINWKIPTTTANEIITRLIRQRFVDDHRFAMAFTRDKFRFCNWGRLKIKLALSMRHIPEDAISDALGEIDQQEYIKTINRLLHIKAKTIDQPDSYDGRTRLFRYVASRGFEPSIISATIREGKWLSEE